MRCADARLCTFQKKLKRCPIWWYAHSYRSLTIQKTANCATRYVGAESPKWLSPTPQYACPLPCAASQSVSVGTRVAAASDLNICRTSRRTFSARGYSAFSFHCHCSNVGRQ